MWWPPQVVGADRSDPGMLKQAGLSFLTIPWASARAEVMGDDQVPKGRSVDALAPRGDEGRGTLRKGLGSREQALIQTCPNGETHLRLGLFRHGPARGGAFARRVG